MSTMDPNKSQHIMSRLMSLTTFFITILIEVYAVLYNTSFNYLIEIVSINFIFILTLLGIRSWLTTRMFSISTMGNVNGNGNGHSQNTGYEQQQTRSGYGPNAEKFGDARSNEPIASISMQARIESPDTQNKTTNEDEGNSERKTKFMVDR
ncbi:MAG: hypothetical protein QXF12_02325 [Candidatus Aenigmatarchaeota archaeon]